MNEFLIAILIICGLTLFSWFTFLIFTIIDKNNIEHIHNGCPVIHTIGDLFAAMKWRVKYTTIGDAFNMPIIINWGTSIFVWAFMFFYLIGKIINLIRKRCNTVVIEIPVKNYFSKLINKISNITIFK
jgi:hypothetical protein